jgi:sugar/nucleoside kinase (ribokinase family)
MECSFDIAIAGELNLDLILYGLPADMSTERELLGTDFVVTLGSSSAIAAHNLAAMGMRVLFQSVVGDDQFGRIACERLAEIGVDITGVQKRAGRKTGVTVLLPHGEERHILTFPGTIADLRVTDLDVELLTQARHIHFCSLYLQKNLHTGLPDLLRELKGRGMTISLDPNDDPDDQWWDPLREILPWIDIFMPNELELLRITQTGDFEEAVSRILQEVPICVVKRGGRGALVASNKEISHIPALTLEAVVDTIGAGDSFDAGFLRAFLSGIDVQNAGLAGNISGALSTQGSGGTEAFRNRALQEVFLRANDHAGLLGGRFRP